MCSYLPYTASQEIGYGDIDEDLEAELAALLEPEQSELFTCCYILLCEHKATYS